MKGTGEKIERTKEKKKDMVVSLRGGGGGGKDTWTRLHGSVG